MTKKEFFCESSCSTPCANTATREPSMIVAATNIVENCWFRWSNMSRSSIVKEEYCKSDTVDSSSMRQHYKNHTYHFLLLSTISQSLKSGNVSASLSKFPSDVSALWPSSPQSDNDERYSSLLRDIFSRDRYLIYKKGGLESCCNWQNMYQLLWWHFSLSWRIECRTFVRERYSLSIKNSSISDEGYRSPLPHSNIELCHSSSFSYAGYWFHRQFVYNLNCSHFQSTKYRKTV